METMRLLESLLGTESSPTRIHYLLEEDELTLDFKPFVHEKTRRRYMFDDGKVLKPRCHDAGATREDSHMEMLQRMYDLVADAALLKADNV